MIPLYDILKINFPNAIFGLNGTIQLTSIGEGVDPVIQFWGISNCAQPTPEQITAWQTDPTTIAAYTVQQNAITNAPIIAQLKEIDNKSIRALRTNDTNRLTELETQAAQLRSQLAK